MKFPQGVQRLAQLGLCALAAWSLGTQLAAAQDSQPAVWTPKELRFTYMGFTTHYSCDGLRDQVREILLQLGARKEDLKIQDLGCTSLAGRPEPFPGVAVKMHVLQPAGAATAPPANGAPAEAPVGAHWKAVDLFSHMSRLDAAGQCELYEQVKHNILPLFTIRNVDYLSTCVPHELSPGGQRLKAEVLVPDVPPPRS